MMLVFVPYNMVSFLHKQISLFFVLRCIETGIGLVYQSCYRRQLTRLQLPTIQHLDLPILIRRWINSRSKTQTSTII